MNAPVNKGSLRAANATPLDDERDSFAGIAAVSNPEEQYDEGAAKPQEKTPLHLDKPVVTPASFMTIDELVAQIQTQHEKYKIGGSDYTRLAFIIEALNTTMGGKFGTAKVLENAPQTNADLFVALYETLILEKADQKIAVFKTPNDNGSIHLSKNSVHFDGGKGKKAKEFTQEEARHIAVLAMHNTAFLPPNAIRLTGTPDQQALIKTEIEKLNDLLPETSRFIIAAAKPQEPLHEFEKGRSASLMEQIFSKITGKPLPERNAPVEEPAKPAQDPLDLKEEDILQGEISPAAEMAQSIAAEAESEPSDLNKDFGAAGKAEKPDENFIGPHTPDGWLPRFRMSRTPKPPEHNL